ncbi:polysaccharide deacetylase family protein [Azospirillum griseum]|uniref:Chitooligosaccharide deacetylase n=3 Tax=Azospirillum griseum TaxID=2496639 RepID=A0A431VGA6_9PROT|nr:polysaccharide deacetylase family protein [Azospirillum griseum]
MPVLQLGLYSRESDAWYAWESLQRRQPELTRDLKATVSFLDGKTESSGAVLRATAEGDVDAQRLCRRMVGAGFGCLLVEAQPPATGGASQNADASPARAAANAGSEPVPPASPALVSPPTVIGAPAPAVGTVPAPMPTTTQTAMAAPTVTVPVTPTANTTATAPLADATVRAVAPIPTMPPPSGTTSMLAPIASATAAPIVPPPSVMAAVPPLDGTVIYTEEDARTMADIEQHGRTKGRLRSVVPDSRIDVMPATLKREGWNLCALTFDDGPHRTVTRQILEVLNREGVRATYFPVGRVAQHQGDLIRDFVTSGHEIGNHSLTHSDLRVMPVEAQRYEVAETNRILRSFGANPVLFRPPYGRYSLSLLGVARNEQMNSVLWTVDTRDWKVRNADKIVEHIKTAAGTGSVFLMHSTYPSTAEALPRVIAELRAKGCEFVTLTQWLERMRELALPKIVNAGMPTPPAANAAPAARN